MRNRRVIMADAGAVRMRVRFTAEIDYRLKSRGEGVPEENDPGTWTGYFADDVQDALETVLRWPELSLSIGDGAAPDERSRWTPTDIIDESCRRDERGRIVHVDGCDCRNAVVVVDVEIERGDISVP
jgi:hypothetical protein